MGKYTKLDICMVITDHMRVFYAMVENVAFISKAL